METQSLYETYLTALDTVCQQYPLIDRQIFGKSYIGRDLPALVLGRGDHRLLYVGGVTGSMLSAELLLRFVKEYAEAVQSGRCIAGIDISYLYHTRTITVVPLLNPDGAILRGEGEDPQNPLLPRLQSLTDDRFHAWEANGRGVDLRCNFDAQFDLCMQSGSGIGQKGYPGVRPESEPESAAVCHYLRAEPSADLALVFLDSPADSTAHHSCIAWNGGDGTAYRTRSVAEILARDISGCSLDRNSRPGSLKDWYRTISPGPLLEISCPDESAALTVSPGEPLSQACVALRYGQLRKMLFHGTVL